MDATSSRTLSFFDTSGLRRPLSIASSTGTQVHGAPRSLAREVEHIKSLISRANLNSRGDGGGISATVFRLGARQDNVTQAHILHELDALKRRIKGRPHDEKQPIIGDPETDSESEDVADERDEELDSIRDELKLVREQREKWIEAAEERIDKLSDQRDSLLEQLTSRQQEFDTALKEQAVLTARQQEQNQVIAQLKSTHAKQIEQLQDAQGNDAEQRERATVHTLQDKDRRIEALESIVKDQQTEVERAAIESSDAIEAVTRGLNQQHAREMAEVRQWAEEQAKERQGAHDNDISAQRRQHDAALALLRGENAKSLIYLRSEHESAVAHLKSKHAAGRQAQQDESDAIAATSQQEHESVLASLGSTHDATVANLKAKHAAEQQAQQDNNMALSHLFGKIKSGA